MITENATLPPRDATEESRAARDPVPIPRQLPPAIRDFTGQAADLLALDALLPTDSTGSVIGQPGTVVISAIDGAAGIGKTTLAVYWTHRFPDGTLYANLRGYGPGQAVTAAEVLNVFLRALGTPLGRIPTSADERAALYRCWMVDGCWLCWTTPTLRSRCGPCFQPGRAASHWSPAARA